MELVHEPEVLRAGDLEVRPGDHLALAKGRALVLSVRELQLLAAMVRNKGKILAREELYALVWGDELREGDRSVDVYVHKLRTKLARALPDDRFIHTHFGFGYRLEPEPSHPFHKRTRHQPQDGYR